jgi:hypothetical protein
MNLKKFLLGNKKKGIMVKSKYLQIHTFNKVKEQQV